LFFDSIRPVMVVYVVGDDSKERNDVHMKVIITQAEAMQKNIWDDIMLMFGRTDEDEVWDTEQFILTEEQARKLGLLK
jgi:DNA-binding transcriptional regulator/RsmH inhibitor MraZ